MEKTQKHIRALIVEDSEDDMLLLVRQLRKGGFELEYERVETAEAMETALAGSRWDIILADYSMPRFSGLEALDLLHRADLDIPFILVSGKVGEDAAVEAMILGAQDYILKDNYARLIPAIERELKQSKIHEEKDRIEFEQKLTEEALIESEELFQRLVEHSPVGIMIADQSGRVRFVNPMGCEILGQADMQAVLGHDAGDFFQGFRAAIESDDPVHEVLPLTTGETGGKKVNVITGPSTWAGKRAVQVVFFPCS